MRRSSTHLSPNKILIGPSTFSVADSAPRNRLLREKWTILDNPFKRKLTKKELLELLSDNVIGLIAGLEPLDREVLSQSSLKVISRCGAGVENVDMEAAHELGIRVYSTPDAPTEAVAELTLGMMLALLRQWPKMNAKLHEGKWEKMIGYELRGKTVFVIGLGRIGRRVAELLEPFRTTLLGFDPKVTEAPPSVQAVSFEEGLARADIITLHASTSECLLGDQEFQLMKRGVWLLNASRGHLIDEKALADAIQTGIVGGAWCDAFETEPYEGPLSRFSQVLLTPHIGSYTRECRVQMETKAVENLISGLKEVELLNGKKEEIGCHIQKKHRL